MMMMAEAPPVAAAATDHLPVGRNDETAALLLLLGAGAGAGAVLELGDPPNTVCSKACTSGKKGIFSRLSGLLYNMAFSPHWTFRPAVGRNVGYIQERERVWTSVSVCMLLLSC